MTFECPGCDGFGCGECEGGRFDLTECPVEYAGRDAFETAAFAGLFEKGLPPLAGGALDQMQAFLDAARFVWGEEAEWKAQLPAE